MDRRQFLRCGLLGMSAIAASAAPFHSRAFALDNQRLRLKSVHRTIEVNGKSASVMGLIGPDGRSGLTFEAGQPFSVLLENQLREPTIIHWHGLTPPWESDGVPDAPMPLIAAGASRSYDFPLHSSGTHWMHAHTLQEQSLLAAPLIVRSAEDAARDEQEVVILLHDFSFTSAEEIIAGLKKGEGHGNGSSHGNSQPGQGHSMNHNMTGHKMPAPSAPMPGGTGSMAMDINDIEYDAYLANDRTLDDPEVVSVEAGAWVRLRIINGATATGFSIDLGALKGELIAVDGKMLAQSVSGSRFPLSMGQRADIRIQIPKEGVAYPILALREGARQQTGIVLQPKGAKVLKLAKEASSSGPILDMALEERLRALAPMSEKAVDRSFEVALNGDMDSYNWRMDMAQPISVRKGERVEITMRNPSMMSHPMHLHGHSFQVVAIDGRRFSGARRDTVNIAPGRSVTIAIDADNPGKWAFHCHHLYHMVAGMMETFAYEK